MTILRVAIYCRVSTEEQNADKQEEVYLIFEEFILSKKTFVSYVKSSNFEKHLFFYLKRIDYNKTYKGKGFQIFNL